MKNAFFTLLVLLSASQARANLLCNSNGSMDGIVEARITELAGGASAVSTTVVKSDMRRVVIESQTQGTGTLETSGIVLFQDLQMGLGTTRYTLQNAESGYQIVKSFQCDWARGEEHCPIGDDSFQVRGILSGVSCTKY
ncbi:MAG: hypothetical protein H7333_09035 [Bdellovibrionales bacterium]|nr:hypothetical protein [Oligoflexia bacterium]